MRNLLRLMKIPSSLKPTILEDTRARSSSARHLHLHGGKSPGKAVVIQICLDPGCCYVMHIFHSGITPGLRELLKNSVFTKKLTNTTELSRSQQYASANAVASWRIYQMLKSLPYATKGDELEKKKLKTDATKGDELEKKILKTDATKDDELKKKILKKILNTVTTKGDELKRKILKTVTTKGDELKRKILKMALLPLLACKSWMALISDTFFINSHKIKNQKIIRIKSPEIITIKVMENINSRYVGVHLIKESGGHENCIRLFWTKVDRNLRFIHSPVDTTIVHCNGVFLIGRTAQRLQVCNPVMREVVALPPTTYIPDAVHVLSGVGIGLDRSTNKYKVVRIFLRDKGNGGIEVITVDGGNYISWRQLKTYPPYMMTMNLTVVTVQGAAYWIINKINERNNYIDDQNLDIQRLDLSSEEFTVIDSPDPNQVIHLAELQGQLCCFAEALDETLQSTIWVWLYESNNIATDHWTLRYTIHHLWTPTLGHHASFKPIAIDHKGCLLFECLQYMHRYDPRSKHFNRMPFYDPSLENKTWYCHTTSSMKTLVPLLTTCCD